MTPMCPLPNWRDNWLKRSTFILRISYLLSRPAVLVLRVVLSLIQKSEMIKNIGTMLHLLFFLEFCCLFPGLFLVWNLLPLSNINHSNSVLSLNEWTELWSRWARYNFPSVFRFGTTRSSATDYQLKAICRGITNLHFKFTSLFHLFITLFSI